EKAPKIAVYTPKETPPWDDAVTMVLSYAEIPYEKIYDGEVLGDQLLLYDWLHLHHEDFTGQYGKFYGAFRAAPWYIEAKMNAEAMAHKLGFDKVSGQKLAVALRSGTMLWVVGLCLPCVPQRIVLILPWPQGEWIFASPCSMGILRRPITNLSSIMGRPLPLPTLSWNGIPCGMNFHP